MSHPLDHALVIAPLRAMSAKMMTQRGGRSLLPIFNSGGIAPLMISLDPRFKPHHVTLIHDVEDDSIAHTIERLLSSISIEVVRWSVDMSRVEELAHHIDHQLRDRARPLPRCLESWSIAQLTCSTNSRKASSMIPSALITSLGFCSIFAYSSTMVLMSEYVHSRGVSGS